MHAETKHILLISKGFAHKEMVLSETEGHGSNASPHLLDQCLLLGWIEDPAARAHAWRPYAALWKGPCNCTAGTGRQAVGCDFLVRGHEKRGGLPHDHGALSCNKACQLMLPKLSRRVSQCWRLFSPAQVCFARYITWQSAFRGLNVHQYHDHQRQQVKQHRWKHTYHLANRGR